MLPAYAELHCLTNFSFLRGASHPEELVERAHALGYAALAITDECSVAGVVRAYIEAKKHGLKIIVGTEVQDRERSEARAARHRPRGLRPHVRIDHESAHAYARKEHTGSKRAISTTDSKGAS